MFHRKSTPVEELLDQVKNDAHDAKKDVTEAQRRLVRVQRVVGAVQDALEAERRRERRRGPATR